MAVKENVREVSRGQFVNYMQNPMRKKGGTK